MIKRLIGICLALMLALAATGTLAEGTALRGYSDDLGYQYVALGRFAQGENGEVQPIVWRVLAADGETAYLLLDGVFGPVQMHHTYLSREGFTQLWKDTDLYAYANGEFLQTAFTDQERAALTTDEELGMISLPSADDIKNAAYGFKNDKLRQAYGSAYAHTLKIFTYRESKASPYWTRTPSSKGFAFRTTKSGGAVGYLAVTAADLGFRPAITLDLSAVSFTGAGTLEAPLEAVFSASKQ